MRIKTLLTSIGLGAGLMYFLDPQHGTRRRTMVVDRANRFVNNIDESIDIAVEDARTRAHDLVATIRARRIGSWRNASAAIWGAWHAIPVPWTSARTAGESTSADPYCAVRRMPL